MISYDILNIIFGFSLSVLADGCCSGAREVSQQRSQLTGCSVVDGVGESNVNAAAALLLLLLKSPSGVK